jgi:plastin-1
MAGFVGIVVSDPWLQNQFTQVELRSLKSHFMSIQKSRSNPKNVEFTLEDLSRAMSKLKNLSLTEEERTRFLEENFSELEMQQLDFEKFLRIYLKMQGKAGSKGSATSAFLKTATTTLLHTISESEKAAYVNHINNYLGEDNFLRKYLPIDPLTDDLFQISKNGVLLW